jgi:hypothetical protein
LTTAELTLNLKYIDVDTQEVIDVINEPSLLIYKVCAEQYAINLGATVVSITPAESDDEWTIKLKIPSEVRQRHTPRSGERVRFTIKLIYQEYEVSGIYQHKKNQFHIVQDDYGGNGKSRRVYGR